jgi:prolyl-tRNA synthetase
MVMTHSDDDGLILPPKVASAQVVIVPILHKEESKEAVLSYAKEIQKELKKLSYHGYPLQVVLDEREMRGGDKVWSWIKKGVPIRLEIGPRDVSAGQVCLTRRDRPHKEMNAISKEALLTSVISTLDAIQASLYDRALAYREKHTHRIDSKEEFYRFFTAKKEGEIHGGFALCHWNGDPKIEEKVKEDLNVTIRCIPLDLPEEEGVCLFSGEKSLKRVLFAKSY